jgi:hypothetical protein
VTDYAAIARVRTRRDFVAACPSPFLVGTSLVAAGRSSQRTVGLLDDDEDEIAAVMDPRLEGSAGETALPVMCIRKLRHPSPDMITVGRTPNNDLVLEHPQISSLHAFFREEAGRFELADAGSRNGTWVSGRLLAPKGPPEVLAFGDQVRLAHLEFMFLSPSACWDALRGMAR